MIIKLNSKELLKREDVGNKALNLNIMAKAGMNVPAGIILDRYSYNKYISDNNIGHIIKSKLAELNKNNIKDISNSLCELIENTRINQLDLTDIINKLDINKRYAIRSSATKEDLAELSFAGQYTTKLFVECERLSIEDAILECYKSLFSETSLSYIINHRVDYEDLAMSVVIQEMIDAEYSGVCFTSNPITGKDTEMLIEIAEGIGEDIVSGKVSPEQYSYNWKSGVAKAASQNAKISCEVIEKYGKEFFNIQLIFGFPCDIEFAIKDNKLYILQARGITKLNYAGYKDIWTTADFKDSGVSATVCKPYMWSLYEYIWEYTLRKFIIDSKLLSDKEIGKRKLGDMYFGRCYWNLSVVKEALSKIIGYKEREFDSEYGVKPTYEGDGETTGISLKSLSKIAVVAMAQNKILNERNSNHENYKKELLETYEHYKYRYEHKMITDIEGEWLKLTKEVYLYSESTYFWQIFINTVHQSLYKEKLLKYVSESEYLKLLCSITNISHLLPFYDTWKTSRKIRNDVQAFLYWKDTEIEKIIYDINNGASNNYNWEVVELVKKYGYHSDKELDVTYPCYYEDITTIVKTLKDTVLLTDEYSPFKDNERGAIEYEQILNKIKSSVSIKKYKKIKTKIENMRNMLWWREEYRDISTRFYYLIRVYTLELAKYLVKKEVLEDTDDIFYIKVSDLWDYVSRLESKEQLQDIIKTNKLYYNAFRNYMSDNEIGGAGCEYTNNNCDNTIKGIGANSGVITGTARVIESFEDIDRLKPDDILVTKFTDTGWTPKFAVISGIVTEYGGILCHAAIVSREYNIPAIVNCSGVMSKIKDGDTITINGETGEVVINT